MAARGTRGMGPTLDSPAAMVHGQLRWAINHDMPERVELLAAHDADIDAPLPGGQTPIETALLTGNDAIIGALVAHGAALPQLDPADALIAAAMRGDRAAVDELRDHAAEARARRPSLVVQAAVNGRADVVALVVELGFDVNALGRADLPVEQPWETALHVAAGDGNVEVVRALLALGADPTIRDARFDATPLGWAEYMAKPATAEILAAIE